MAIDIDRIHASMERLHSKVDKNLEEAHKVQVDMATVKEHLKAMNDKVSKNVRDIAQANKQNAEDKETTGKRISKVEKRIAKWAGAVGAILILLQLGIYGSLG